MEEEVKKYKLKFIIIVLVLTIISALLGASYALLIWHSENNTELTVRIGDVAGVYFETGPNINVSNLGPVFDYEKDGESTYFTISNYVEEDIVLDAYFNITNITSNLKEESFKYVIMSSYDNVNYTKVKEDNFININTNDTIDIFNELVIPANSTISYKIIVYIDGNMLNPVSMQNGSLSGVISVSEHVYNLDTSGANAPELTDNLVPVMHNGTTWVTADSNNANETYQWYDYNVKKWANAVLLTETKRNSLTKDSEGNYTLGQTIGDTESAGVLAFYVWIPRYKYKVWNINKVIATDSYSAQTKGIDIEFIGKDEEGTITCTYSFAAPVATAGKPNETCTGANGDYYTHPAFKFGSTNLAGIWVGKFEISSSTPTADYGGGNSTSLAVRMLPNVISWRRNLVTNFWKVIDDMQASGNEYGLTIDHAKVDSHMLTNMEWGAVAYLTHSKYGRCNGSSCTEVAINSYYSSSTFKTGCGPQSSGNINFGSICNAYTSTLGLTASTTGNVYGVYDMSCGAWEYVMGNMSSGVGSYTHYASSGGTNYTYNTNNSKYITTYANGSSSSDQTAYNRGRLGEATSEVVAEKNFGWYSDIALFPNSSNSWFERGGDFDVYSPYAGVFGFNGNSGNASTDRGARSALAVFSSN